MKRLLKLGSLSVLLMCLFASFALAQNITVRGTVTDTTGESVIGATVVLVGNASKGSMTDLDGHFTLRNVPSDGTIRVSYIGMKPVEVPINGQTELKITLQDDTEMLDEVVVVGYGTQKKVNLTGAVATVNTKQLTTRPVQNVGQALQGVVPGLNLNVNNSGGELNNTLSLNIRGAGTIGTGSSASPLILIDGAEGNMNSLNPSDIESISVLKDASSSAIYGSRAAFGVILITTKNGRDGKPYVSYNGSMRFSTATQIPRMMDSEMFANYFNRAAQNAGNQPIFSEEIMEKIRGYKNNPDDPRYKYGTEWNPANHEWKMYSGGSWANTDWFAEMYRKNAPAQEHNISLSGGTKTLRYYVSGAILDQRGLIRYGEDIFKRYNTSAKLSSDINTWLNVSYQMRWSREDYSRPAYMTGLFYHNIARRWPVNAVTDPNGYLILGQETIQMRDGGKDNTQTDRLDQQLVLQLTPVEGWIIRLEGNYRTSTWFNHWDKLPIFAHDKDGNAYYTSWEGGDAGQSAVSENVSKTNYYNGRFYTEYSHTFGKHFIKGVAGMDMELNKYRNVGGTKKDLITPEVPTVNTATNDRPSFYGGYSHWSTMGLFGRINYVYDDKYLAEVSIRRDGSSRFIGDKTWGTFPSFSLGWNIANEGFFEPLQKNISMLKLRGSFGQLGNTATQSLYPWFQALPNGVGNSNWLLNGERHNTSNAPSLVSASLTWEQVEQWNVGLDFAALNNRLEGTFDVYQRTTKNMVGPSVELPSILGTAQPMVNNTDMLSKGWEMEIKWRDAIRDFNYGLRFTLSDDKQIITKYFNETKSLSNWYSGRLNGEIWGYTSAGIAKTDEEMTKHLEKNKPSWGNQWGAGDMMYQDLNGDGVVDSGKYTLDDPGDLTIIGNSQPHYRYGLTADASWKGFDFMIFLQGVGKRDWFDASPYTMGATKDGMWQSAGFVEHWDFFRPEGDPLGANLNAYYPRPLFDQGGKNAEVQTHFLQDASYLRIKNAQLGYTLPLDLTGKVGISRLRIYTSVDNLATFTKLSSIFDPEATGGGWGAGKIYPLSRVWSVGVNINF